MGAEEVKNLLEQNKEVVVVDEAQLPDKEMRRGPVSIKL